MLGRLPTASTSWTMVPSTPSLPARSAKVIGSSPCSRNQASAASAATSRWPRCGGSAGTSMRPSLSKRTRRAGRQHDVGGAHDVEGAAAAEGVQPDAAAGEPAGEGGAQVRRVDRQREIVTGEAPVHGAQPCTGADHAHVVAGVDVDVVEPREVQGEAAVARHRATERARGGGAQRHGHALVACPAQRLLDLGHAGRQKDDVGDGARQQRA